MRYVSKNSNSTIFGLSHFMFIVVIVSISLLLMGLFLGLFLVVENRVLVKADITATEDPLGGNTEGLNSTDVDFGWSCSPFHLGACLPTASQDNEVKLFCDDTVILSSQVRSDDTFPRGAGVCLVESISNCVEFSRDLDSLKDNLCTECESGYSANDGRCFESPNCPIGYTKVVDENTGLDTCVLTSELPPPVTCSPGDHLESFNGKWYCTEECIIYTLQKIDGTEHLVCESFEVTPGLFPDDQEFVPLP